MQRQLAVLITGVGSPGAPGVIESLRLQQDFYATLIGVDANPQAIGCSLVDRFYTVPQASEKSFIPTLLEICEKEQVRVILPMVTAELIPLAQHIADFTQLQCSIPISPIEALETSVHKGKLFLALANQGLPVPQFQSVQTVAELWNAIEALGYPQQPVCFKPTQADGSRGFHVLNAFANHLTDFFLEKSNSPNISLAALSDLLRNHPIIPELLVMEYLPGTEYSVDLLVNRGHVLVSIPRRREQMVGGITTEGTVVDERDVTLYTTHIAEHLNLHGNVGVQVRRNQHGQVRLLEVNPRLQGTVVHCTGAGVNLPVQAVKLALGEDIRQGDLDVVWGTRMKRYWKEIFYRSDGTTYTLEKL